MRLCLVLTALALAALPAAAMDADFGAIGITQYDTARLNGFCDGSVVPTPCDIIFEFHDLSGRTLKTVSMIVQPETTGFVDFSVPAASLFPSRVEINPCFKVLRGTAQPTLELMENFTQRTRILTTWSGGALPKSGGDVDFGAAAITRFDTARMSASCQDDGPACDVAFEFHDANGATLKASRVSIAPGATAFLDLHFADTGAAGGRVTIDPCWTVATGAAVLNLQTIDTFSGFTITHGYPSAAAAGTP